MTQPAWRWISATAIYIIHDRQIAEHGGSGGIRDRNAVESALARPINSACYGAPDAASLAAAYAYGLAKNHGFVDGNKRVAWIAARLFLLDNGYRLTFDIVDAVRSMENVAAGDTSENDLAAWFRERLLSVSERQ